MHEAAEAGSDNPLPGEEVAFRLEAEVPRGTGAGASEALGLLVSTDTGSRLGLASGARRSGIGEVLLEER